MRQRLHPIASNEDGVDWYEQSRVGRLGARIATARTVGEPLWVLDVFSYSADAEHMRPVRCPVPGHDDPHAIPYGDRTDACECSYVEEGWHRECEATDPEAIAVWRVEWERGLPRVLDRLRWRLSRRRWRYRPVLWGARGGRRGFRDQLRIGENRLERSNHRLRSAA